MEPNKMKRSFSAESLTFPKIPPERMVSEYFMSKYETSMPFYRKPIASDLPRLDPMVHLVSQRRILHNTEELLNKRRIESKSQRRQLDDRWKQLGESATELRNSFVKFDEMIKLNENKRKRSSAKIEKELAVQTETDRKIGELGEKLERLKLARNELEKQNQKHKIYEEYLEMVAKYTDEFKYAKEVYRRYEAYGHARGLLADKLKSDLIELESIKSMLLQKNLEKAAVLRGLTNRVAVLQKQYQEAKFESGRWNEMVKHIQQVLREKLSEILGVRKACNELYLQMCKNKKIVPKFGMKDFEQQLGFINKTVMESTKTLNYALKINK